VLKPVRSEPIFVVCPIGAGLAAKNTGRRMTVESENSLNASTPCHSGAPRRQSRRLLEAPSDAPRRPWLSRKSVSNAMCSWAQGPAPALATIHAATCRHLIAHVRVLLTILAMFSTGLASRTDARSPRASSKNSLIAPQARPQRTAIDTASGAAGRRDAAAPQRLKRPHLPFPIREPRKKQ